MRRYPVGDHAYTLGEDAQNVGFWGNLTQLLSTTLEQACVRMTRARTARAHPIELALEVGTDRLRPYGARAQARPDPNRIETTIQTKTFDDDVIDPFESPLVQRLASVGLSEVSDTGDERACALPASERNSVEDPLGALFPEQITSFFSPRDDHALKSDRRLNEESRRGEEALEIERMDVIEEEPFLATVARDLVTLERQNALARTKMAMMGLPTQRRSLRAHASDVSDSGGIALPHSLSDASSHRSFANDSLGEPLSTGFRRLSLHSPMDSTMLQPPSRRAFSQASATRRDRDKTQLLLEHNKFLSQSIHRLAEGYFNAGTP